MKILFVLFCWPVLLLCPEYIFAQSYHLDVEGDAKIRGNLEINGNIDISGYIDTTSVFIGRNAGVNDVFLGGKTNTFVGSNAGKNNAGGFRNSFFGFKTGSSNTGGWGNSFFGQGAGQNNTSSVYNAFFGTEAGRENTTGQSNSFFGASSGLFNSTGSQNSFYGQASGFHNTIGNYNSFFGRSSGYNNTAGEANSFFGFYAGFNNTSGRENAFYGIRAGVDNIKGNRNTFIGAGSGPPSINSDSMSRAIALGYNSKVDCSNCATIGGTGEHAVNVGIGIASPSAALHVLGRNGQYGARVSNANATPMVVERTGNDGGILDVHKDGRYVGGITVTGGIVSYNSFTGSHLAHSQASYEYGQIVTLKGTNKSLTEEKRSEPIYGIDISQVMNSSEVLGSYLSPFHTSEEDEEDMHTVMAVGNGAMWVVDAGENIRIGDYLISSQVLGHAMKDPEIHHTSHVIAKALEHVVWEMEAKYFGGHKHKLIPVTFEQFDKHNLSKIEDLLDQMIRENQVLNERIAALENTYEVRVEN